jgi:ABC-type multidrug transport system fused ATPase/permease subunit
LDPQNDYSDSELSTLLAELTEAIGVDNEKAANMSKAGSDSTNRNSLASSFNLQNEIASGGSNLSAGEKQIIVLARAALSRATHVVVLDEITSNIDRAAAGRALIFLRDRLVRAKKLAVLLIAHNLDDVVACDEVWVMKDGEIVESGKPHELINKKSSLLKDMWSVNHSMDSK